MTLEEAIKTAIDFEIKVRDTYMEAKEKAENPVGARVFHVLAKEEAYHVAYLERCLKEWKETGKVTEKLETTIPDAAKIEESARELQQKMEGDADSTEAQYLERALQAEKAASDFYRDMVSKLDGAGQELFKRFLEVEDGHLTIVQAEIDSVKGQGFWFDMAEFQLEAE